MSSTGATVIGKVAIKVVPDTGDFRKEAQRALKRIERQLDPLEIKLSLAAASKKKVQAELAILSRRRTATIAPKIDGAAAAKVGATLAALSGGRSISSIGSDVAEWAGQLDKAAPKIAAMALTIANLASVALTSSANLLSLGSSLASTVGAGLALPGIFGGLAIGLGASIAVLKDFNDRLPEVKEKLSALQDRMSDKFWNVAETPIRNFINELLPEFSAGIEDTSSALGDFFADLSDSARGKFGGELGSMFDDLNSSIKISSGFTDQFVGILAKLGAVGAGNLPRLAKWFGDISTKFDNFLARKGQSGLQEFVDEGVSALKDLGGTLSATGSLFAGLSRAAEASGATTLATLRRTMESAAQTVNGPKFQNALRDAFAGAREGLDQLTSRSGQQFESLMLRVSDLLSKVLPKAGKAAGDALGAIFDALDQPAVEKSILGFFDDIQTVVDDLAPTLPSVARGLAAIVSTVGSIASNVSGGLAPLLESLGSALPGLAADFDPLIIALGDLVQNASELAAGALPKVADMLGSLAGSVASIIKPVNQFIDLLQKAPGPVKTFASTLAALGILVAGGVWLGLGVRAKIGLFGASITKVAAQAGVAQGALFRMGSMAQRVTSTLSARNLGMAAAAMAMGTFSDSIGGVNEDLGRLTSAASTIGTGFALGGTVGAGIGTGIALFQDFNTHLATFKTTMDQANAAIDTGNLDALNKSLADVNGQLKNINDEGSGVTGFLKSLSPYESFKNIYDRLEVKPDLLESQNRLQGNIARGDGAMQLFGNTIGLTVDELSRATTAATNLSDAIADLNGWFDKRAAVRSYRDSIAELAKGLKDGFTRADVENLDNVGRNIIRVADGIKSPVKRNNFITNTLADLRDLKDNAGPKGAAELQKVIDKLKEIKSPKPIKAEVDDKATPTLNQLGIHLRRTGEPVTTNVSVNAGNSFSILGQIASMIDNIHSKTVSVTVNRRGGSTSSAGGHTDDEAGAEVAGKKAGVAYSKSFANELEKLLDKIGNLYEKAIDKAGKHAAALKAKFSDTIKNVRQLSAEHRKLERQLDAAQATLQGYQQQQAAYSETVRSTVVSSADITGLGARTFDGIVRALTRAKEKAVAFKDTILELMKSGLNDTTLKQILAAGPQAGLAVAQAILSGGVAQINDIQGQIDAAASVVGDAAGQHFFGDLVASAQSDVDKLLAQLGPLQERLRKFAHDLIKSLAQALKKEWKAQMPDDGSDKPNKPKPSRSGKGKGSLEDHVPTPHRSAAPSRVINYYAAPNKSLPEEDLYAALNGARGGWF